MQGTTKPLADINEQSLLLGITGRNWNQEGMF